jgi:hypothetical protein
MREVICKDKIDETISKIKYCLSNSDNQHRPKELTLRCLDEAWLSNILAWLLDPNGSHGLGVSFAKDFIRLIAQKRTYGHKDKNNFARKKSHLKFGKSGKGTGITGFSLKNAAVMREFYIPCVNNNIKDCPNIRQGRCCDVVFMDLDVREKSIMIFIENKLFTDNSNHQLIDTFNGAEQRYTRSKIREYVYLTLCGASPQQYGEQKIYNSWTLISWIYDIKPIVEKYKDKNESINEIFLALSFLATLSKFAKNNQDLIDQFREHFLNASRDCLLDELNRLANRQKNSQWEKKNKRRLTHTRYKKYIQLSFLSHLTLTAQGFSSQGDTLFEKVILPFGAHPDQTYNLLDISARELYYLYFGDKTKALKYLGECRRQKTENSEIKQHYKDLFDFVYKNRFKLQILIENTAKLQD